MTREPDSTLKSGIRLGPYELIDLLGAGGMGQVYRARDTRIGRLVAIKVLPSAAAADQDRVRRFEQEARTAGSLNHPNLLTLYDVGTRHEQGTESPFLVMELLVGATLRDRLRRGANEEPLSLNITTILDYALQMARGLQAAHAAGIVHRDLKPENVFVTSDGTIKILDFGLAKLTAPSAALDQTATGTGVILGTVGYMAPEQIRGQSVDQRADVFAFGAVLYEMLAGRRAFESESAIDTLGAILNVEPPPLPATVPAALLEIVRQCLEKDPARRPSSLNDVAQSLEPICAGDRRRPVSGVAVRRVPHRLLTRLSIAMVALVVLATIGFWRWRGDRRLTPQDIAARRVVAVLPFQSISPERAQDYFASGMTEEIMSQLSTLSSLRVMSRPAVARYTAAGADLKRIGPELGVGSLVTGSVRLAGSRVRIDVQLVDAASDEALWSNQYDRDMKDVLGVQSEVARRIAVALQAALSPAEAAHLDKLPTTNVQAYQLYLRARMMSTVSEQNKGAVDLLRQAIALDPSFSDAHAALAIRLGWLGDFGDRPQYPKALAEAKNAVTLDPSSGRAHYAVASIYSRTGRLEDARLSFLRAAELDPNSNRTFADLSITEASAGHFDQALHWARRMFVLAPNVPYAYYHVGVPLQLLAANDQATRWLLDAERRLPGYQRVQILLSNLETLTGHVEAGLKRARRAVAVQPQDQEGQNQLPELALLANAPDAASLIEARFNAAPEGHTMNLLPETFRLMYAYTLLKAGNIARAQPLLDEALAAARREIESGSEFPDERIEVAAVYALRGNHDESLKWLDEAYRAGWRLYRETALDPMFESVRNVPGFQALLRRMEHDVAVMRERAHVDDLPRMPPLPPG